MHVHGCSSDPSVEVNSRHGSWMTDTPGEVKRRTLLLTGKKKPPMRSVPPAGLEGTRASVDERFA